MGQTLFNIYIANIPKTKENELAQFANETILYTQNSANKTPANDLGTILEWKIKANKQKTVAILFRNKEEKYNTPMLIHKRDTNRMEKNKMPR